MQICHLSMPTATVSQFVAVGILVSAAIQHLETLIPFTDNGKKGFNS